ncbi:Gamma-secretase-activating protein [Fukomys damarensis]|uniref:Gamma-secretase-activating protein n=1 Tax=Fukomys damarensis TaxID=885580 RepID=A0A091E4D1_FUKDA|nr:Gamma-secretase-activating protein [Fukomys damarensis]
MMQVIVFHKATCYWFQKRNFETALDIPLSSSEFKLVNFGCGYQEEEEKLSKHLTLYVFTSHTGYRKTFTVAPGSGGSQVTKDITFLNLDFYVAVYLPGHFFHLLNIQHPDLICHSLFLTGNHTMANVLPQSTLQSLSGSLVLDWGYGKLYRAALNPPFLLQLLGASRLDCERMAALHCLLACGREQQALEAQIIQWISENFSTCHSFDLIQEFIIASSYWSVCPETRNMDVLLQYSSVLTWNKEIPGITLVTEEIPLPLMKVRSLQGYWEKLNSNLEHVKYAMPPSRYTNGVVWREWHNLVSEEEAGKRRSTAYMRNILHNAVNHFHGCPGTGLPGQLLDVLSPWELALAFLARPLGLCDSHALWLCPKFPWHRAAALRLSHHTGPLTSWPPQGCRVGKRGKGSVREQLAQGSTGSSSAQKSRPEPSGAGDWVRRLLSDSVFSFWCDSSNCVTYAGLVGLGHAELCKVLCFSSDVEGKPLASAHTLETASVTLFCLISEPRLTPVLQEEDPHQRLLMGLMVSELKDHLLRHLQGVKKKIIEQMAVDYTSKLKGQLCFWAQPAGGAVQEAGGQQFTDCLSPAAAPHLLHTGNQLEEAQSRLLGSPTVRNDGRGSAAEFAVFHLMTRILEATSSLFLPLPPGFHTLHTILGVHCLPLHSLLHYIDNGVLFLTETAVTRLLKDLDNTEKNEKLKFSIIVRLPPLIGRKIYRLWDHPVSSIIISRNHVTRMLKNYKKQPWTSVINKSSLSIDFLPLNYLIEILTRLESSTQALNDLEGHDNVDAEFVEEAALKHTTVLLGL